MYNKVYTRVKYCNINGTIHHPVDIEVRLDSWINQNFARHPLMLDVYSTHI